MITREVLAAVVARLADDPRLPSDLGDYTWGCVPAWRRAAVVPVEVASAIVAPSGQHYSAAADLVVRVKLEHTVPLTGVANVTLLRFGYDEKVRIVAWSCE